MLMTDFKKRKNTVILTGKHLFILSNFIQENKCHLLWFLGESTPKSKLDEKV